MLCVKISIMRSFLCSPSTTDSGMRSCSDLSQRSPSFAAFLNGFFLHLHGKLVIDIMSCVVGNYYFSPIFFLS